MLTSILSEFASSIIDAMAMAMEFGVPKDCKDSPFHSKWRHFLLEYVKGPWFLHLPAEVKLAIKKFLDHPTSLPYDEQRIDNFMTNRFAISLETISLRVRMCSLISSSVCSPTMLLVSVRCRPI